MYLGVGERTDLLVEIGGPVTTSDSRCAAGRRRGAWRLPADLAMRCLCASIALLALASACSAPRATAPEAKAKITFIWHAGERAELLSQIAADYTRRTGVEVEAILPPLSDEWHERIVAELDRGGAGFDLCIFDSQSMSELASAGHLVRLNDLLAASDEIGAADFDPQALRRYSEYPEGSGDLYALPINQDAMGLVARLDLLESAVEKERFRARYGYELAVPETYAQLRDVAAFFTRPEEGLYGIALYGSADYDAVTSAFNNLLWSSGADLWDPASGRVAGVLDSPRAKGALAEFVELFRYAPPGASGWYVEEVNDAVRSGRVALAIHWYYFFDELAAATAGTPVRLAFATLPAGSGGRFVMVGGQGVGINRHSPRREEAWAFIEWFMSEPQQRRWAAGGGRTGLAKILADPDQAQAGAASASFPLSMSLTKDYWHLSEYPELLRVYQRRVHEAVAGELSPGDALELCAREHEEILAAAASAAAARPTEEESMRVTVVARIRATPGMESRVEKELRALLAPTRAERGCIHYDMYQSAENPAEFLFFESWESDADLDAHLESPHIRAWFELSKQLLAEPIEIWRWSGTR